MHSLKSNINCGACRPTVTETTTVHCVILRRFVFKWDCSLHYLLSPPSGSSSCFVPQNLLLRLLLCNISSHNTLHNIRHRNFNDYGDHFPVISNKFEHFPYSNAFPQHFPIFFSESAQQLWWKVQKDKDSIFCELFLAAILVANFL